MVSVPQHAIELSKPCNRRLATFVRRSLSYEDVDWSHYGKTAGKEGSYAVRRNFQELNKTVHALFLLSATRLVYDLTNVSAGARKI